MKAKFQKETALKGLLFLVLLGNVSWRPAMRTMNLTELASSQGETMGGRGTSPAQSSGGSTTPTTLLEEGEQIAVPNKDGVRATGEGEYRKALMNVCGVYAYVQFRETAPIDGSVFTAINIRPHSGGTFRVIDRKVPGSIKDNLDNPEMKKRIDNDNTLALKNQLGSRCAFVIENEVARAADGPANQDEDKKKDIKRGQEACRNDSKGGPLSEIKRLDCELSRLSSIDVDSDRRGGELRAMTQIEKIVKEIRPHLMKRLMSADDSVFEEGKEYLEETIETLKTLTRDLMLNPARMSKIVMSLEALQTGGESFRRSEDFDKKVRDIKEEARQEVLEVESRIRDNPRDPIALNDRVAVRAKLLNTYRALIEETKSYVNPAYTQLYRAERSGLVTMSEFAQFANPYQILARDLNTLSNPQFLIYEGPGGAFNPSIGAIGASYGQPTVTDFNAYRNNLAGIRLNPIAPSLILDNNAYSGISQYANSENLQGASVFGAGALNGFNDPNQMNASQINANRPGANRFGNTNFNANRLNSVGPIRR